jgi:nucleoside-diphosphate-sugar epimerase
MLNSGPIIITGAAGLVGQNLIAQLKTRPHTRIVGIDKHAANTRILSNLNPDVRIIEADLAKRGAWEDAFGGAQALVLNHAQIGGVDRQAFIDNSITATQNVLAAAIRHRLPYMVFISSATVLRTQHDLYTKSKQAQEQLVVSSGIPCCVLRPTIMFGWFDRKHWAWFARFMARFHFCPIPGHGQYFSQPLYVRDFCRIIISCLDRPRPGEIYNISGRDTISYLDMMRAIRDLSNSHAPIILIPRQIVWLLLRTLELLSSRPPFTTQQLRSLVSSNLSEVIDWPNIFAVQPTPLSKALHETFRHPIYSKLGLK